MSVAEVWKIEQKIEMRRPMNLPRGADLMYPPRFFFNPPRNVVLFYQKPGRARRTLQQNRMEHAAKLQTRTPPSEDVRTVHVHGK